MVVNVQLFGILGILAKERRVALNLPAGSTLGDVVAELGRRFGRRFLENIVRVPGELHSYCEIFVNNQRVDQFGAVLEAAGSAIEVGIILLMASEGG